MSRQINQIEEVAREINHVSSALQDLYASLGEWAINHHIDAANLESTTLYDNFTNLVSQSDALQTRIKTLKDLHNSILDGKNRVKEIEKEKKALLSQMDILYSKIGAIIWEEYNSHVLSDIILKEIPELSTIHHNYTQVTQSLRDTKEKVHSAHSVIKAPFIVHEKMQKMKLTRLQKHNTSLFVEFGRTIACASLIPLLVSQNAMNIEAEYDKASQVIEKKDIELHTVIEQMNLSKNKLEEEGAGTSLARKIGELENAQKDVDKQRKLSAVMYGKSVTTMMSTQKESDYPQEMVECFDQIIEYQNLKTELLTTTKKLNIEKKIEELVLLLRQDEEHILHIEVQIGQLNQQIKEIHKTMATKKEQIGALQQQLVKILPPRLTHG